MTSAYIDFTMKSGGDDSMNYQNYKASRDAAWDVLIRHKVNSLPVKIGSICRAEGIVVSSYRKGSEVIKALGFEDSTRENDGFAVMLKGKCYVFYDDTCSVQRQRFTVAHELGHFVNGDVGRNPTTRNKEPSESDNEQETAANVFASRILAPACVLWALKIHSAEEIAELCDISIDSAKWRMMRLELLYIREEEFLRQRGRSCFLLHPKERAVYEQFLPFIKIKYQNQI